MIDISASAPGRAPNLPVNSVKTTDTSTVREIGQSSSLRTQTFIVRGHDKHGRWKQMRVKAPNADGAQYIAHQNEMRIAECVQIETKI